jgi:GTP cyclohydrolase I
MQIRGIAEPNSWMITTSVKKSFLEGSVKEEFMGYIKTGVR